MIGYILVATYFLSIGYNTIMLDKIRKDTIKKCREKLEEVNYDVNPSKIKSILTLTSYGKNDFDNYIMSYMPFGSYHITRKLMSGKMKREYEVVSESMSNPEILSKLKREQIISSPSYIKTLSKEEKMQFEKTHQIYKPGDPIFTTSMERLIDGLPVSEQLSMDEMNSEFDRITEESAEKVLKKERK